MTIWIDAQLSPALAEWLAANFDVDAVHVQHRNLVEATDAVIFDAARAAGAIVLTKDRDFVELVHRRGPPPRILWLTCGNTANSEVKRILATTLQKALEILQSGEEMVEIKG